MFGLRSASGEHVLAPAPGTITNGTSDLKTDMNLHTENTCPLIFSTLIATGIDVNIKDNRGLTALDIVRELPSQKSQHIAALIEGRW